MPDLVLGGIALGVVITALIQVAKHFGLPEQYAPYLNVILSAVFGILVLYVQGRPDLLPSVTLALQILIMFLSAAGYYTTAKFAKEELVGK